MIGLLTTVRLLLKSLKITTSHRERFIEVILKFKRKLVSQNNYLSKREVYEDRFYSTFDFSLSQNNYLSKREVYSSFFDYYCEEPDLSQNNYLSKREVYSNETGFCHFGWQVSK